ncbi:MAG: hypothetical protein ACPGSM_20685, partial [Thiolinea sp.]
VRDSYQLGKELGQLSQRYCLTGHFSLPRYAVFFQPRNVFMFFRDPVQRVLSHYGHSCRVNGFDKGFEAFCQLSFNRDVQAKTLSSFPPCLLGYIGLQEHYGESLSDLSRLYGISLSERISNVNAAKVHSVQYECSAEELTLIHEYNQRDFSVYAIAKQLFEQRRQLEGEGKLFVHGCVREQTLKKVSGWVMSYNDDRPVDLLLHVNGVQVAEIQARDLNLALNGWNSVRQGYGGFTHVFKKPLADGDEVECRVATTGQLLLKV